MGPEAGGQARNVLLKKWRSSTANSPLETLGMSVTNRFRKTFAEPLSSAKRKALCELFLAKVRRSGVAASETD